MDAIAETLYGILHSETTTMIVVVGAVMGVALIFHWGLVVCTEHATGVAHNPVLTKIGNGFKNYWARVKEGRDMCRACQVDGHVDCGRENWTGANTETLTCACCVETDSFTRESEHYWREIERAVCHQIADDIDGLGVGFDTRTKRWVVVKS